MCPQHIPGWPLAQDIQAITNLWYAAYLGELVVYPLWILVEFALVYKKDLKYTIVNVLNIQA